MDELVRFGISMPAELLKTFDHLIASRGYGSRSEAFRDLARREIVDGTWDSVEGTVTGVLYLVYDHHSGVGDALTNTQHTHHQAIVCTVHVHLDHEKCMELIVLRGPAPEIKGVADRLISLKGVQYGKLMAASIEGAR